MTDHGTFIINGAERVIISQIVRSPGRCFGTEFGKLGKLEYTSQIIPNRGAWLELEEDENGIISVRIDRARKFPLTIFLRTLGMKDNDRSSMSLVKKKVFVLQWRRILAKLEKSLWPNFT